MSALLHDVLRPHGVEALSDKLSKASLTTRRDDTSHGGDEDEDELVNVMSLPGTPARSRPASRPASRASSPTRRAKARAAPGPLHISPARSSDPLKAFPTDISQRIFRHLAVRDLASCSVVCKKWSKSQTLNYIWFQHYRRDTYNDDVLEPGKWTRRESKQNWRQMLFQATAQRANSPPPAYSSRSTPGSGYQTPRELREEKWAAENTAVAAPGKLEMRDMYKALNGRKVRGKGKIGTAPSRDRGGWEGGGEDW